MNQITQNHTLMLYNEDENLTEQRELFKNVIKDIKEIPSMSIQKITPVLILEQEKKSNILHPLIKLNNPEELISLSKIPINEEKNLELHFKDTNNSTEQDKVLKEKSLVNSESEILKVSNTEEERRNLDKINIFRGFYYANDHQGNIDFECNEESQDCDIEFHTTNQDLKTLFDIEV